MIDQCVIETVEGGFPEVNKYVHASCLGENEKPRGVEPTRCWLNGETKGNTVG